MTIQRLFEYIVRFFFLAVFVAFIGLFVYAFFLDLANRPDPEHAPFTAQDAPVMTSSPVADLSRPHRSAREIEDWLSEFIANAFSLDTLGYYAQVRQIKPHFTPQAHTEYKNSLDLLGVYPSLQRGDLKTVSVVEDTPLLLDEGVVEGRYHWLYQAKVTMSLLRKDAVASLPGLTDNNFASQRFLVQVQIARVEGVDSANPGKIENWGVGPLE